MQQETLLVSAIILIDNESYFLADAIYSAQSQSYQLLEIIVIDSSSHDRTADMATQYAEIRYYYEPGSSKAAASNLGINLSKGDVIAFLDADDVWTRNKLSNQLDYLITHPDVEIVQGLIQNLPSDTVIHLSEITADISDLAYEFINPGSLLCRRSLFQRIGAFDETLDENAEIDWFMRAWEANIIKVRLNQITLLHRQRQQTLTRPTDSFEINSLKTIKKYIDRTKNRAIASQNPSQRPIALSKYIGKPCREIVSPSFTIISDDCWGGLLYTKCEMRYNTPFVGIRIEAPCYLELLKDLRRYVESPLTFTNTSNYIGINCWRAEKGLTYPIGVLGDKVELQFVHESDESVCREKWQRRIRRINWNNLFVKFREDPWNFRKEYLTEFDQLQYEYKVCFTQKEYPEFEWAIEAPDYFKAVPGESDIYNESKKNFDALSWIKKNYGSDTSAYKIKSPSRCSPP